MKSSNAGRARSGPAIILVGHGSKARGFDRAMKRVAKRLQSGPFFRVQCAYLEINSPSIPQSIHSAVHAGAKEIRVLPYFVLSGRHVAEDIPRIVKRLRRDYGKKVRIRLCPSLGFDERIVRVALDRIGKIAP